jgi:hypothetical protein
MPALDDFIDHGVMGNLATLRAPRARKSIDKYGRLLRLLLLQLKLST